MKKPLKLLICMAVLSNIGGCATLELVAMSGASYLITGKSLTDNAVSTLLAKDCALHRIVQDRAVCEEPGMAIDAAPGAVLLAQSEQQVGAGDAQLIDSAPLTGAEEVEIATLDLLGSDTGRQVFAVVGSFGNYRFALERQAHYSDYNAEVVIHNTAVGQIFRVIAGPFDTREKVSLLPSIRQGERQGPWAIELCAADLTPPPCEPGLVARVNTQ